MVVLVSDVEDLHGALDVDLPGITDWMQRHPMLDIVDDESIQWEIVDPMITRAHVESQGCLPTDAPSIGPVESPARPCLVSTCHHRHERVQRHLTLLGQAESFDQSRVEIPRLHL